MPTGDASSSNNHSTGATPFKVQVNINILIFEGHIDAYVVDKWLNMLEEYFSVHDFSNREKITFPLLKVAPIVNDSWETYCEHREKRELSIFSTTPTRNSFRGVIKEQYYPVDIYEDKYIQWTTSRQQRIMMCMRWRIFSVPCAQSWASKIRVLKYHDFLHKYIHEEIEFLDISSLSATYRYVAKIKQKFKQKKWDFGFVNLK